MGHSGRYAEGEERWVVEYSSIEAALADARRHGATVGAKTKPWRTEPEKRGVRVAEYALASQETGWHAADIVVEYDSGLAAIYGSL